MNRDAERQIHRRKGHGSPAGKGFSMTARFHPLRRVWLSVLLGPALVPNSGWPQSVVPGGRDVAFSPDGTRLATGTRYFSYLPAGPLLWDVKSGKVLAQGADGEVLFAPGGQILATILGTGARLWDARTGKLQTVLPHPRRVRGLAFAPGGQLLATVSEDPLVRLWDARTGRLRRVLRGHRSSLNSVAFAPDGQTLATAGQDATIRLWDPARGRLQQTLRGHTKGILALAFSPDGRTLASAGWDTTVRLWDRRSGQARALGENYGFVQALAFSPDGKWLGTYECHGKTNEVLLWAVAPRPHAASWQPVWREDSMNIGTLLAFDPKGRQVLTRQARDIPRTDYTLRDLGSLRVRRTLTEDYRGAVAFSPDGRTLAVVYDDQTGGPGHGPLRGERIVHLWDTRWGWLKRTFRWRPP
jgi:WD40 repeat protein